MATERPGLIMLDIGLLLDTRSPQLFAEAVDLYPGAQKILDAVNSLDCQCGQPMCDQDTFQYLIKEACQKDYELAAKFIERVDHSYEKLDYEDLRVVQQEFFMDHYKPSSSVLAFPLGSV